MKGLVTFNPPFAHRFYMFTDFESNGKLLSHA